MNDDGWIKLHRSLFEWQWYNKGNVKDVFLHLLLLATSKPTVQDGIRLERGQCMVKVLGLTKILGLTHKQLRTAFAKLINTGEIEVQGANKFTIVTICKYDYYQGLQKPKGQTRGKQKGKQKGKQIEPTTICVTATCSNNKGAEGQTKGQTKGQTNSRTRVEELDISHINHLDKNNKKDVITNSTTNVVSLATTSTPLENFGVAVAEVEDLGEKKNEAPLQEVLNPNKRERETAEAIGRLRTDLFSSSLKCESAMRTAGILDEAELRTMVEDVFTEWELVGTPPEDVNLRHLLNQLRIKVREARKEARKAARQPKTRQERIAESLRQIYAPAVGINKNDNGTDKQDTQLPF